MSNQTGMDWFKGVEDMMPPSPQQLAEAQAAQSQQGAQQPDAAEQPQNGQAAVATKELPEKPVEETTEVESEQQGQGEATNDVDQAQPEDQAEQGEQESASVFEDVDIFGDVDQKEEASPEKGGDPTKSTKESEGSDIWAQISQKLGREVKSVEDLASRPLVPSFEGYSEQTSTLINQAIESGSLTPDEIATGEIRESWGNNPVESLVHDAIAERLEKKGIDTSTPEGREAIESEMDEMTEAEMRLEARQYAMEKDLDAKFRLNEIRAQISREEATRAQKVQEAAQRKQSFFLGLQETASRMEKLPGSDIALDDSMKKGAVKLLQEAYDLPQESVFRKLLGNPGAGQLEGNISRAVQVLYPAKIQKIAASRAKNDGIRQAIQSSTGAPTSRQEGGKPVSTVPNKSFTEAGQESIEEAFWSGKW